MDEKNPLLVYPKPSRLTNGKISNKRGRPATENIIKFSPQPKSIIAQMLLDMKTDKTIHEDEDLPSQNDQSQDLVDDLTKDHVCQTSSFRSDSVREHKKHLTSHQRFLCNYPKCSYSCKLSSNLIKHKRMHTNEKPYLCEKCSFRTNFVNSLKAHRIIHTDEKPYQCQHCKYKCNSSSNLKKHCLLRHSKENKYKFK